MAHYLDKPHGDYERPPAPECADCPEVEGRQHGYSCFTPNYGVIGPRSCRTMLRPSIPTEMKRRVKRIDKLLKKGGE